MKKGIVCLLIVFSCFNTYAQNIGIGTTTPKARLHVSDSSVLFSAADPTLAVPGNTPLNGAGARMMWYAGKAAFRTGYIDGAQWDKDSIGFYSFAAGANTRAPGTFSTSLGYNTHASGYAATSMGHGTIASGSYSISMGYDANASGPWSISMGYLTNASNYYSISMGERTTASGTSATSMGLRTTASGDNSTSMGYFTNAIGRTSTSMGFQTIASGDYSTSIGFSTKAKAYASFAMGDYNDDTDNPISTMEGTTDRIFQIGNGTSDVLRSNALTVLRNSNVGIGTTIPTKQFEVIGAASATPVTLVIGNRGGFGPAALEFVSDYAGPGQWRPGYIKSSDQGGFTGILEFYTNGAGNGNLYGNVKGFEVRSGFAYTATGTVLAWSDARLKNNITAFTDGLNVINKINPVQFYYNADAPFKTDQQQVGVIAQDLEKLAPYMIGKNKQDGYRDLRSVNNQAYTFLLINSVKEQQQQIEKQQNQIETSNEEVKQLQQQVTELKKLVEQLIKK